MQVYSFLFIRATGWNKAVQSPVLMLRTGSYDNYRGFF